MAEYVRGFVIPDVAEVHAAYRKVIDIALEAVALETRLGLRDGPARKQLARLQEGYRVFQSNLRGAAQRAATAATQEMRDKFRSTKVRVVSTGNGPGLLNLLIARPLELGSFETGAVGIADVKLLGTAINPNSRYGTYWRAQEYGTGADGVPSQIGRVIFGAFYGGGETQAPASEYAGGGGPHPVFISERDNPSGGPGFGTIGMEIKGRHFIRDGADAALIKWRTDIARAQDEAIAALRQVF